VRNISEQELKQILDKHGKWLRSEDGGERANLRSADLRYADLRSANLRSVNLRSANLSFADLSSADLRYANLRSADLRYANISFADLRYADLSSADLSSVDGLRFPPLQVVNTKYLITIMDDHVRWGCELMTFDEVKNFKFEDCKNEWDQDEFKLNKKIITEMIRYYRKGV